MAWVIHKYPLSVEEVQRIRMPSGAKALSLQLQRGVPTLWCRVDTRAVKCDRLIKMCGTGWEDPFPLYHPDEEYIGTVQINGFVWHYFWGNIIDRTSPEGGGSENAHTQGR